MAVTQLSVYELAEEILSCVCTALDVAAGKVEDQPGCPCRACLVPGVVAWDDCSDPCGDQSGEGGQLTVSFSKFWSTNRFPEDDLQLTGPGPGCAAPLTAAAEFVVTLLRCVPGPDEGGCPPTCEEQATAARVMMIDAATVYNALECCLPNDGTRRGRKWVMGGSVMVGPQGGCAGIEQRVSVALRRCGCPEEDHS